MRLHGGYGVGVVGGVEGVDFDGEGAVVAVDVDLVGGGGVDVDGVAELSREAEEGGELLVAESTVGSE